MNTVFRSLNQGDQIGPTQQSAINSDFGSKNVNLSKCRSCQILARFSARSLLDDPIGPKRAHKFEQYLSQKLSKNGLKGVELMLNL